MAISVLNDRCFSPESEMARRYVDRLNSLYFCRLSAASRVVNKGFFYDRHDGRLSCSSCDFKIRPSRFGSAEESLLFHWTERHSDGEEDDLATDELKERGIDKFLTDSYKALASHLRSIDVKLDARVVKALLDMPRYVFLINKGFQKNLTRLAIIIQLCSNDGKDFDCVEDQVDLVLKLSRTDVDALCREFEELLYVPAMKVVIRSSKPSMLSTESLASTTSSAGPPPSSETQRTNQSTISLMSILKSVPSPFGSTFDLVKRGTLGSLEPAKFKSNRTSWESRRDDTHHEQQ